LAEKVKTTYINNPANHVLLQVRLGRNSYFDLLRRFSDMINEEKISAVHSFRYSQRIFAAKFELNYPTFAAMKGNILGAFEKVLLLEDFTPLHDIRS
jgi:hypothetical protein